MVAAFRQGLIPRSAANGASRITARDACAEVECIGRKAVANWFTGKDQIHRRYQQSTIRYQPRLAARFKVLSNSGRERSDLRSDPDDGPTLTKTTLTKNGRLYGQVGRGRAERALTLFGMAGLRIYTLDFPFSPALRRTEYASYKDRSQRRRRWIQPLGFFQGR